MTIDEAREVMMEHNAPVHKRRDERRSIKLAQIIASADEGINVQETNIQHFNIDVT